MYYIDKFDCDSMRCSVWFGHKNLWNDLNRKNDQFNLETEAIIADALVDGCQRLSQLKARL